MSSFTIQELKPASLDKLKDLATTLEVATYGSKKDIASRIATAKGGKGALTKLLKTSAKEKDMKAKGKLVGGKAASSRVEFFKKERARLIAAGATNKKKIDEECKRLWGLSTSKCKGGICKKPPAKAKDTTIVTSTKILTPAEAKSRGLTLIGADASNGKTVYKYKSVLKTKAAKSAAKDDDDDDCDDCDDSDDEVGADDIETFAIDRLMGKKIKKREYLDGMNEAYGVDTKGWTLAHAKEELVIQMLNETDDEASDDEEEEDDEEDEGSDNDDEDDEDDE